MIPSITTSSTALFAIFLLKANIAIIDASIIIHPFMVPTGGGVRGRSLPSSRLNRYDNSSTERCDFLTSRGGGSRHKQRWGMPSSQDKIPPPSGDISGDISTSQTPSGKSTISSSNSAPIFSLAALTPSAGRLIRAALILYGTSELLSFLGFFNSQQGGDNKLKQFLSQYTPQDLNETAESIRRKTKQYVENAQRRAQQWWQEAGGSTRDISFQTTYSSLSDRSRFGLGAICGYTVLGRASALLSYPIRTAQWITFSYLAAELLHSLGLTGQGPRIDDYVDKKAVREFARETDMVDEMEDVMNYVDKKMRSVDEALQDFKLTNRRKRGTRTQIRRFNALKWADNKIEDWRRFVRSVLGHPQQLVDYIVDVAVRERHLGVGLVVGSFMGSIL